MANSDTGAGSVAGWNAEWRNNVTQQIQEGAKAHQNAALIMERIKNELDEHDKRITKLETQPNRVRANFDTYGGCLGAAIMGLISGASMLVAVVGIVLSLVTFFLTHH